MEKFSKYDAADYLKIAEERAAYLAAAVEDGDPAVIATALGDIARAEGISKVASKTGMSREGLYKALSPTGNASFATIASVTKALGLKISIAASGADAPSKAKPRRRKAA